MCQWITEQKKLLLLAVFTTHIRAPPHYGAAILRSNNLAITPNILLLMLAGMTMVASNALKLY